jgi:hypothetical protein
MVPARPFLSGRRGAIERLDLAFFVDGQHDGGRRRIDIEPDDVAQLGCEVRVLGELELAHPMRLQPVGAPDALNRTHRDADGLGHHLYKSGFDPTDNVRFHPSSNGGHDPLAKLAAKK